VVCSQEARPAGGGAQPESGLAVVRSQEADWQRCTVKNADRHHWIQKLKRGGPRRCNGGGAAAHEEVTMAAR
jgi:hypothetical protein